MSSIKSKYKLSISLGMMEASLLEKMNGFTRALLNCLRSSSNRYGRMVTKDAVLVGIPAKVMKYRFVEEEINILHKTKWWESPDHEIARNSHL